LLLAAAFGPFSHEEPHLCIGAGHSLASLVLVWPVY
jgi:hypothetical protein